MRSMKVRVTLLLFSMICLVLGPVVQTTVKANTLSDIPEHSATELNKLIDRDIIAGYEDGTFKPNRPVTREEAATMIGRALQFEDVEPKKTIFTDVDPQSYASGYIQAAVEQKIISGYGDGTFRPEKNITRLEMAYLLSKAFQLTDTSYAFYVDMPTETSQMNAIRAITNAGISAGYPDGRYLPTKEMSRLEFSLMVARALYPQFKVQPLETKQETQYVKIPNLQVRKGPGTQYAVQTVQQKYDKVVTYLESNGWYFITSDRGAWGYVPKWHLEKNKDNIKKVIAIDPGHGGHDPGAVGNGYREKDIVLNVGLHLKKYLNDAGIEVVMTRATDVFIPLDERVSIAVNGGADTFVSIHMNSAGSSSAAGTETYYSTAGNYDRVQASKKLTEFIQKRLLNELGTKNRGEKTAPFRVIHRNSLPSVLVELGFISNAREAQLIANNQQDAAHAIYLGIVDYYKWLGH